MPQKDRASSSPKVSSTPTSPPTPSPGASGKPAAPRSVSEEEIAKRAYERFLQRHPEHGSANEDWLAAEQELLAEAASS